MADEKKNPFEGMKFDLSKLSAVSLPANLAQSVTIPSSVLIKKMPCTMTPLVRADSLNPIGYKAAGGNVAAERMLCQWPDTNHRRALAGE